MKFTIRLIALLATLTFYFPNQSFADETVLIGNGNVLCQVTEESDGFRFGDMYWIKDEAWKRIKRKFQIKRLIKKTNRQIRRATNSGEDTSLLELLLSDFRTARGEWRPCRNGDLTNGGGGDSGPDDGAGDDNSGGGGGGDSDNSGGGGSTEAACTAFESSSVASVLAPRIINGSKCTNASSVAVVEVYLDGGPGCTGTYAGDYNGNSVVVFAAHCIDGVNSVSIVTGGGQEFSVSTFQGHPNWNQGQSTEVNDVAIAIVNGSMSGTIPSIPICSSGVSSGMSAYAAGYGYVNGQNQTTDGLHAGTLTIDEVTTTSIYARYSPPEDEVTSCNGDSGGPIMVEVGGSKCIAGAVSWGSNQTCGSNGSFDDAYWVNLTDPNVRSFINGMVPGFLG